jgi:3-(3-hydroxy-phenyl)propionate hydroxylase
MQPYTYSQSPLTPYASRDAEFAAGPVCGSFALNAKLADGSFLLDRAGRGMTALLFGDGAPNAEQKALLDQLGKLDKHFAAVLIHPNPARADAIGDTSRDIARLYGAASGTLYLVRPDLHIAGRWKTIAADEVLHTISLCLGVSEP